MRFYYTLLFLNAFIVTNTFAQVKKSLASKKSPLIRLATQMASGKKVFTLNCLPCHQADGLGLPPMYPPLSKTSYVLGNKATIVKIVLGGFNDAVTINGDTYTDVMPSFSILKDKEIADLLTYVRNSFGNKASAITGGEVKKVRATMGK